MFDGTVDAVAIECCAGSIPGRNKIFVFLFIFFIFIYSLIYRHLTDLTGIVLYITFFNEDVFSAHITINQIDIHDDDYF